MEYHCLRAALGKGCNLESQFPYVESEAGDGLSRESANAAGSWGHEGHKGHQRGTPQHPLHASDLDFATQNSQSPPSHTLFLLQRLPHLSKGHQYPLMSDIKTSKSSCFLSFALRPVQCNHKYHLFCLQIKSLICPLLPVSLATTVC